LQSFIVSPKNLGADKVPARSRLHVYVFGEWEIDLAQRELRARGVLIPTGGRAFEIIETLVQSAGDLVTKNDLMERVWPGVIVEDNTLQAHISAVRRALGPDRRMLKTVSGRGYCLLGNWTIRQSGAPVRGTDAPLAEPSSEIYRNNLPAAGAELIGRTTAVQQLRELLSAYRVVTLVGPGGIGKTALALEVAREFFPIFQGDVWLIELAQTSDPGFVASSVASAIGLVPGVEGISAQTIARNLKETKTLLVVDNCEHVIGAAAELIHKIVRTCPRTSILATSREALRIEGEYTYPVGPLSVPSKDELAGIDSIIHHSAVKLFLSRGEARSSKLLLDSNNFVSIATICQRLDGIPLAIEFAAARAVTLGLQEVASRLDDRFELLTGGYRTALPRHQTLRATLDWSYDLLPEAEAYLLRQLAMFAGDFLLEAAVGLARDMAAASVANHLAELVTKSLVVADPFGENVRYRLLDTTRAHSLEKLRSAGEHRKAAQHHAEYCLDLLVQSEVESRLRPRVEWVEVYGRQIENLRAALNWAFAPDGDTQLGVALTAAAVTLWEQLSLFGECLERTELALVKLEGGEMTTPRVRMQLCAARAWSLMHVVGRSGEVSPAWLTTLNLADALDDTDQRLRALWGLCIDQIHDGELRQALEFANRFAVVAASSRDANDLAMASRLQVLHYLGDQKGARKDLDRVLAPSEESQIARFRFDHFGFQFDLNVSTRYFQARILWLEGFADQALRVVERSIEEGRAIGHALTLSRVLGMAACPIALLAGDLDAAERYCAALLDHTERYPTRIWYQWATCFKGVLMARRGNLVTGLSVLRNELDQAGDAKSLPRFLILFSELATCLVEAGEFASGLSTIDETLAHCERRNEQWYMPELLRIRGDLLLRSSGELTNPEAENCFHAGLKLAQAQGALFWELRNALSLARLRTRQDRHDEAGQILKPVYDRFSEGFGTADLTAAKAILDLRSS
jgi:predicted ATPase/DNA-binding winged helix-turn-helix (wHTH) protein